MPRQHQAVKDGARQSKACEALGLSERTVQRWTREDAVQADNRKSANREAPGNKLSVEERQAIVDVCNSDRFKSLPPSQIVPVLADEGEYLGSERTFYRVLHERGQQHHRGRSAKAGNRRPTSYCATGPNQVWSWDITFCVLGIRNWQEVGHRITSLSGICYVQFRKNNIAAVSR